MLPLPRVLVVDDEKKHSDAIADALRRAGVECVPALYDEQNPESLHPALRGVRILLSDLHLIPLSHTSNVAQICQPLEELITKGIPSGTPFVLVLWTAHPEELVGVRSHLLQRLPPGHKPLAIHALSKTEHLAGGDSVADALALASALSECLRATPAAAALLEWEELLAKSARSAVDDLHRMVVELGANLDYQTALAALLAKIAKDALGGSTAALRPAAGLSEVLMPIIADALSMQASVANQHIWDQTMQAANGVAIPNVPGRMNGRLHIGGPTDHGVQLTCKEPGAVVELPAALVAEPLFSARFGQTLAEIKKCVVRNGPDLERTPCQPVLVRIEAPCDHAQGTAGPPLFALGVIITAGDKKQGSIPEIWWPARNIPLQRSDIASLAGADKLLLVNARALFIPVGAELDAAPVLFRLRPPLASLLAFHFGTRVSRPGIIEFR